MFKFDLKGSEDIWLREFCRAKEKKKVLRGSPWRIPVAMLQKSPLEVIVLILCVYLIFKYELWGTLANLVNCCVKYVRLTEPKALEMSREAMKAWGCR